MNVSTYSICFIILYIINLVVSFNKKREGIRGKLLYIVTNMGWIQILLTEVDIFSRQYLMVDPFPYNLLIIVHV